MPGIGVKRTGGGLKAAIMHLDTLAKGELRKIGRGLVDELAGWIKRGIEQAYLTGGASLQLKLPQRSRGTRATYKRPREGPTQSRHLGGGRRKPCSSAPDR